jgi:uncharacterized membrane protein YcgQ (UPF0703/DUF1980 family)
MINLFVNLAFINLSANTSQANPNLTVIAVIISGVALLSSIFWNWRTFNLNKKHHILMVRPLLSIETYIESNRYIISLKNIGNGPAILQNIEFPYKGQKFSNLIVLFNYRIKKEKEPLMKKGYINEDDEANLIRMNYNLGKDETIILYRSVEKENIDVSDYNEIFNRTSINIEYTDLYGKKYKFQDFIYDETSFAKNKT